MTALSFAERMKRAQEEQARDLEESQKHTLDKTVEPSTSPHTLGFFREALVASLDESEQDVVKVAEEYECCLRGGSDSGCYEYEMLREALPEYVALDGIPLSEKAFAAIILSSDFTSNASRYEDFSGVSKYYETVREVLDTFQWEIDPYNMLISVLQGLMPTLSLGHQFQSDQDNINAFLIVEPLFVLLYEYPIATERQHQLDVLVGQFLLIYPDLYSSIKPTPYTTEICALSLHQQFDQFPNLNDGKLINHSGQGAFCHLDLQLLPNEQAQTFVERFGTQLGVDKNIIFNHVWNGDKDRQGHYVKRILDSMQKCRYDRFELQTAVPVLGLKPFAEPWPINSTWSEIGKVIDQIFDDHSKDTGTPIREAIVDLLVLAVAAPHDCVRYHRSPFESYDEDTELSLDTQDTDVLLAHLFYGQSYRAQHDRLDIDPGELILQALVQTSMPTFNTMGHRHLAFIYGIAKNAHHLFAPIYEGDFEWFTASVNSDGTGATRREVLLQLLETLEQSPYFEPMREPGARRTSDAQYCDSKRHLYLFKSYAHYKRNEIHYKPTSIDEPADIQPFRSHIEALELQYQAKKRSLTADSREPDGPTLCNDQVL